jgi:aryl-alcohol dehydrogenase-like predicted oxidoreductase
MASIKETVPFEPKNMIYRNLGDTGLRVPVFSYGGWLTVGGTQKGDVVKDLMQKAFDLGINMFDVSGDRR